MSALVLSWLPIPLAANEDIARLARETISLELSRSEIIRQVRLPDGIFTGGLGATAASLVFPLLTLGLTILTLQPTPTDERLNQSFWLEVRAVQWATVLVALSAFTGMIWANFSWGGASYPDPWLFGCTATLLLLIAWHVADISSNRQSTIPSWLAMGAMLMLLWTTLGPALGWTAPSLHYFGP